VQRWNESTCLFNAIVTAKYRWKWLEIASANPPRHRSGTEMVGCTTSFQTGDQLLKANIRCSWWLYDKAGNGHPAHRISAAHENGEGQRFPNARLHNQT